MRTYVAFLRGINVGGKAMIKMPELRSLLGEMGFEDVSSYVQSGNVVFKSPRRGTQALATGIEKGIAEAFAVETTVLIRTAPELSRIAGRNPFQDREKDLTKLHVVFLSSAPAAGAVAELDPSRSPPDEFSVDGREIYLHLPNGAGRSKLTIDYFEKRLGVRATARNWRTLTKLVELSEG
jgi:uncharacterized protein (DUF1697 family)